MFSARADELTVEQPTRAGKPFERIVEKKKSILYIY